MLQHNVLLMLVYIFVENI